MEMELVRTMVLDLVMGVFVMRSASACEVKRARGGLAEFS